MKQPKVVRSGEETKQAFDDQLRFLRKSCDDYDAGDIQEAVRLAASMRVLLNDSGSNSHSLLSQLDRTHLRFLNTAGQYDSRNLLTYQGLVCMRLGFDSQSWEPYLDNPPRKPEWLRFTEWWGAVVICDSRRDTFTRRDLVRYVANQDGGAHVDPEMDERYALLKRNQSTGWRVQHADGSTGTLADLVTASVRQIAYEVLRSLTPQSPADVAGSQGTQPNEPCPCGSGRKFKKCHKV
ncbi:MAG: SEC-C domain-containing protein [Myxococcaceae bacterium]